MGLELLSPMYLGLLGLLAPLVAFYILKVQRRRKRVASTWLWQQAQRDLMARSPFKRLVLQIPLVLQALALIALAIAAASPATRGRAVDGDHVAIVIDTSASMSATDPEANESRLALAKAVAHDLVDGLAPGSDATILDAGRESRVALPPDRDTRRMHDAIDAIVPRQEEGDLGRSLALAVDRLAQLGGRGRVYVLTDGNLAQPHPATTSAIPVDVVKVGSPVANAAIVRVDVRTGHDPVTDKEQVQAFLLLQNSGSMDRELFVTMRQQNASDTLASRKVVVPSGESLPVVLSFYPTEGDYGTGLVFDLSPHDYLPLDDVAYGRVPEGRKLPVYAAAAKGKPSAWLLRALVSDELAEVRQGSLSELMARTDVPHDGFVVIEGACPRDAPGGDLLIVGPPGGECFDTMVGSTVEAPTITSWASSDVRLRFLTLEGVFLQKPHLLEPPSKRQELIRTDQGVVAADISTSGRYATLLGFDVGESNWPLKASFVLFVRNLMEQARRHRASGVAGPAKAGLPLRIAVPADVTEVEVAPPTGEPMTRRAKLGLAVVPDTHQTGIYRVSWQGPQAAVVRVPVNLTSPDESDLARRLDESAIRLGEVTDASEATTAHHRWGWILALVALAFVLFDVWYFTRQPRSSRREATA